MPFSHCPIACAEVRVDTWVETGMMVTPYYDSLIAKLMVHAPDRPAAIAKLLRALSLTQVFQWLYSLCLSLLYST